MCVSGGRPCQAADITRETVCCLAWSDPKSSVVECFLGGDLQVWPWAGTAVGRRALHVCCFVLHSRPNLAKRLKKFLPSTYVFAVDLRRRTHTGAVFSSVEPSKERPHLCVSVLAQLNLKVFNWGVSAAKNIIRVRMHTRGRTVEGWEARKVTSPISQGPQIPGLVTWGVSSEAGGETISECSVSSVRHIPLRYA